MKRYSWLLIIIFIVNGMTTQAQDTAPPDDTMLLYFEDDYSRSLDHHLLSENICLEAVIRLNPNLDINHVPYGTPIRIPVNQPCYLDENSTANGTWAFRDGSPKRLKYYEDGEWLAEPYYSDDVVYLDAVTPDYIAQKYNVCLDELLAENVLLLDFERYRDYVWFSMDVFIPSDSSPCPHTDVSAPTNVIVKQMTQAEITPTFFPKEYNICAEEVDLLPWRETFFFPRTSEAKVTVTIPTDVQPCYQGGQRLSYYNALGKRRNKPRYSNLQVYVVPPRMTIEQVAVQHNVCLLDLLRVNGFPDTPLATEFEVFIPPSRSCPRDVTARKVNHTNLHEIAVETNICPEILLTLNPHFERHSIWWELTNRLFFSGSMPHWIVVPTVSQPCLQEHIPSGKTSIYELEQQLNVCHEAYIWGDVRRYFLTIPRYPDKFYTRIDALPCYNELGQRLFFDQYNSSYNPLLNEPSPGYADMPIHRFQPGDTVYSISQHYNVCVHDLLRVNPTLQEQIPTNYSVFIPLTRPCYDQATRLPLVYEDEAGNPLPEPRVADQLMYYGSQPLGRISYYYNVCINRIEDANRAKLSRERSYLGWIIPTDRPPCYDEKGYSIDYVCYNQPIDFTVDYQSAAEDISFDIEGSYCYDLAKPETVVWYHNKPYQIVKHREQEIFSSRAFMAWCFGVSLDEIDAINADPEMLALLPYYTRAIPKQTRECYVQNPYVLASAKTIHVVQKGETVTAIAARYDVWPHWIAQANDLNEENMIWARQSLIIPDGLTVKEWILMRCAMVGLAALCGLIYLRHTKSIASELE